MRRWDRNSDGIHKKSSGTMFLILALVLSMAVCIGVERSWAAPFAHTVEFTQPDQVRITLWGEGDEFRAIFETTDGYTVIFDTRQKAYYFADVSEDGRLASTGVLAHHPPPQGLAKHIRPDPTVAAEEARARREKWDQETGLSRRWSLLKSMTLGTPPPLKQPSPPSTPTVGSKVGLTLLIDFPDDPATITQSEVEEYLNGDSYTGFGNNGSVKQYFYDVSGSRLTYTNIVTAYVRMAHPKSYYNDTALGAGGQGVLLIKDAMAILMARSDYTSTILPTFASLSTDDNGYVSALNVFFAGNSSGVWNQGLWPHSWTLDREIPLGNGKYLFRYQITNQGQALLLGTFCHENGHMLCSFPDIYDYEFDSVGGAGRFCLMNSGGSGANPSQVSAYLRLAAGWATATDLDSATGMTGSLAAAPYPRHDHLYRYRRPGVATEYFLLENRQRSGRDANLPAAGIAIWHVDEWGNKDNQSLEPNEWHQNYEVTLVQADNEWHFQRNLNSGDPYDLYYEGNGAAAYAGELTDTSAPNAHWWDGTPSELRLNSFSASGAYMTFKIEPGNGTLPAPVLADEPPVTPGNENTIFWSPVSSAPVGLQPTSAAASGAAAASGTAASASAYSAPAPASVPSSRIQGKSPPAASGPASETSVIMSESFEGEFPGTAWRVTGSPGWGATSHDKYSGSKSAWCGASTLTPEDGYADNMSTWMIYGPFSLQGTTGASMTFWYKNMSEFNFDSFGWYASIDGVNFHGNRVSGDQNSWRQVQFDLGDVPVLGNLNGNLEVWVAFLFYSDFSVSGPTYAGAFVDDVVIASTVSTEAEYFAEAADNSAFTSPMVSGWIPQTQWTFPGLAIGTTYWYRVKARIGIRESGWSNVVQSMQEELPTISGIPPGSVTVGSHYSFTPTATRAASFEVVNLPSWAVFDVTTGTLSGSPANSHVGSYPGIVITARNNAGTASLPPFTITVVASQELVVTVEGTGGGTVTSSPAGISCIKRSSTGCSAHFPVGSSVSLFATADSNSTFGGWSGACTGSGVCSLVMTGSKSVAASFNAAPMVLVGEMPYQSLQAACAAASDGATVRARDILFQEYLVVSKSGLRLQGGNNAAFTPLAGHYTTIKGSLKIRKGPTRVDRVVIR